MGQAGDAIPFYFAPGGFADHLFPTCPALVKSLAKSKDYMFKGRHVGDPYDETVCGWCQRVYRARLGKSR